MPSQSLFTSPCLHAWYEAAADILHLDWQGRITLSAVQVASVQVAQLALVRRYARVLICTRQVQAVGQEVAGWLALRLPLGLSLLGTHCLAWVCPVLREGTTLAQSLTAGLPLASRLFTDTAAAEGWLHSCSGQQAAHPAYPQPVLEDSRLRRLVGAWQWQVLKMLVRHPLWPLAEEEGSRQPIPDLLPKAVE
jgi:hypothetical protein